MDSKTPAQVAEECEEEALIEAKECRCPCMKMGTTGHADNCPSALTITRALAARAWATAERCRVLCDEARNRGESGYTVLVEERDRLRREFEALVEKGEDAHDPR